jgi:serine/threonine protein kinase
MSYQIGRYTVINPFLGGGGQAHLVEAEADGQRYALKLLTASPDDAEAFARFGLEAEILKTIDHPHIVRYVDHGVDGETRYIAMPKLPGRNLRFELAERRRLDVLRAASIARQIATALQVFHQLGAVHRDVKPENVQLDDGSDHVWLLDAGYARYVKKTRITDPNGRPPGTEGYRAPETLQGYDYKQSDFFSLGLLLYEMIAGRHPYGHQDPDRGHRVVPIRQVVPECPAFLGNAVEFLLAWDVKDRPQNAAEVLSLLDDPARGFRIVRRTHLPWAAEGVLPLLFRVNDANLTGLRRAAEASVRPDAYISTGSGSASLAAAAASADAKRDLIVDPELHQVAYTGFEEVPGFASIVFSDHDDRPLTVDDLHDPGAVQALARLSLDAEAELSATVKLVPTFLTRDTAPEGWLGCNSALLDECVDVLPPHEPFAVRVLTSLEAAPTVASRQRLADAIGRHSPDLFLVTLDGLGPNASSEQLLRALELVQPLRRIARCVICDAGAFAPFWFAFDLGVSVDLVAESSLVTRPNSWAPARFEFPSILGSLRLDDAEKLATGGVPEVECPCFACRSANNLSERLESAAAHNAAMASRERANASAIALSLRQASLRSRLELAQAREGAAAIGHWERRVQRLSAMAAAVESADARLAAQAA